MTTFSVPDMSCGHCKASIEKAVKGLDPAAEMEFDMGARRVTVHSAADDAAVQAALKTAGYEAMAA